MSNNTQTQCYPGGAFIGNDGYRYANDPYTNNKPATSTPTVVEQSSVKTFSSYCMHCDLEFDDIIEYEHHNVEMHGQKKLLICPICTATFRRQDHLKRHTQSLHKNQKFCKCPVCDKDCLRQDILLKHIKKKHTNKTDIFRCRECEHQCDSLPALEKHEFSHMNTERHICSHCNTTFKRRDHMLRHVKSQHLNQSVVCPLCGQVYKRKDHVARHVREKHKMGYLNGKLVKSSDIIPEMIIE